MEVERATAPFFGVEINFPDLAQRVGLYEVALIVNVKPVIDGMVLKVGYVPGDIDRCHSAASLAAL